MLQSKQENTTPGGLTMYLPKRLLTYLIAEDNLEIMKRIEELIEKQFTEPKLVLKATTLKDGEEIIQRGLVDIAIIDLYLPDGNGDNLIATIREDYPFMPIILQTIEDDLAYQAKIHKNYNDITYITKKDLFDDLPDKLNYARSKCNLLTPEHVAIERPGGMDIIYTDQICYIFKTSGKKILNLLLYDLRKQHYYNYEIKGMALSEFTDMYNSSGFFIRCHNSYILNKKMVKTISREDKEAILHEPDDRDYDVPVPISDKYMEIVLDELKGVSERK